VKLVVSCRLLLPASGGAVAERGRQYESLAKLEVWAESPCVLPLAGVVAFSLARPDF
jgi:hypothetical protein